MCVPEHRATLERGVVSLPCRKRQQTVSILCHWLNSFFAPFTIDRVTVALEVLG